MDALLSETTELLEEMARTASAMGATLPCLDIAREDLAALAGEVQRILERLRRLEGMVEGLGPVEAPALRG